MLLKTGDNTAIVENGKFISYNEVHQRVNATALTYQPNCNAKVAIYSENRPGWVYAFYSAWHNGCTVVPIDFMANPSEVAYILEDCKPETIFCSKLKQEALSIALKELTYQPRVILIDDIENIPLSPEKVILDIRPEMEKTALIIYTSGTTGSPKGVMLSFGNIMANITAVTIEIDHEGGRVQRFREGFTRLPPMAALGKLWDSDRSSARQASRPT